MVLPTSAPQWCTAHFSPLFYTIAHCLCAKLQFKYMYTVSSIYTELWGVLYICDLYTLGYSINKQCTLYWALCTLHQSAHHSLYIGVQCAAKGQQQQQQQQQKQCTLEMWELSASFASNDFRVRDSKLWTFYYSASNNRFSAWYKGHHISHQKKTVT